MKENQPTRPTSVLPSHRVLRRRLALERVVSDLAASFANLSPSLVDFTILRAFRVLLGFFKLDRVALWELSAARDEFVLEQCRQTKGTAPPVVKIEAKHFNWAMDKLLQAQPILVSGLGDLPQAAHEVKKYFVKQGIRSWLAMPLQSNGMVFGALVFVSIHQEADWNNKLIARLRTIADIVANALGRTRAERALQESELLKSSILGSLKSNVAVIDRTGLVIAVNAKWEESAGDSSAPVLIRASKGANYLETCHAYLNDSQPEVKRALDGIQSVLSGSEQMFELEYASPSPAGERWSHMTVTRLVGPEGGAVISSTDITSQKRTEAELRESEERFRKMADEVPVIVWMHGPEKNLIYVNKAGLEYSGLQLTDYLGRKWLDRIHPEDVPQAWNTYETAFDLRRKFIVEYRSLHASGQYRWLLDCGVPRYLGEGGFAGYIGVSVDIHDRKEAEQTRTEFTGRLLRAQEEERSRIGRELHDDFAQRLAWLTIQLQRLGQRSTESGLNAGLAALQKQATNLAADMAQLSHRLHPSYLETFGLAAAVKKHCKETSQLHHIQIRCDVGDLPPAIDKTVELSLYRVLQEALHNVTKHSHATKAETELFADTKWIRLQVSDNGVGFDQESPATSEGLGLVSMKERLHLVGGDLSISSEPSRGTHLKAWAPLASESQPVFGRRRTDSQQRTAA